MKLAIVMPNLGGGGAEFVAQEWAKWLVTNEYDVSLVVTHPRASDLGPSGVNLERLTARNALGHLVALRRLIRRQRFDVLIGMMPYFNLLVLLASLGMGRITPAVVISGRNVEQPQRAIHGASFRAMQRIAKIFYRRADAYIAISHPVAAEAVALYGVAMSKVFVVPNPATAKTSFPESGVQSRLRTREKLNIVVPARLVPQKRPEIAIQVALLLRDEFPGLAVHFFGDGPLRGHIQELADAGGIRVVFHGWVHDWFNHCPEGSVVLLTSVAEGFGNVLVEATAVGVPTVVSSRCLGSSDAIVPGLTGTLCAGDRPDDYADAVRKAHLIEKIDAKGWLERFTPENSGRELERVIRAVSRVG